jgi:hypothetical protein
VDGEARHNVVLLLFLLGEQFEFGFVSMRLNPPPAPAAPQAFLPVPAASGTRSARYQPTSLPAAPPRTMSTTLDT